MRLPAGWKSSKIRGKFSKSLDPYYDLVVNRWDGEWRLYVLKYCGWTQTIMRGKNLKEVFEYAKGITSSNWQSKAVR